MKLWPGWENECKKIEDSKLGDDIYTYKKPGNKKYAYYRYEAECPGCKEPHLAQAQLLYGKATFAAYCTHSCHGKNRSAEETQHVLEANRKPRSEESRKKQGRPGSKHTEETKAKIGRAQLGQHRSLTCIINSATIRLQPDRQLMAGRRELATCRIGAQRRGLPFELSEQEFMALITADCYYCGTAPCKQKIIKTNGKFYGHAPEMFMFNGIDRLNSALGYMCTNVVTACPDCNHAKLARTVKEFVFWVFQVEAFVQHRPNTLAYYGDVSREQSGDLKSIFDKYHIHKYSDGAGKNIEYIPNTLELPVFSRLIRSQCYYCGNGLCNKFSSHRATQHPETALRYNGLDRVDSNGIYELSNVVPCCCHCNRAKLCMAQDEFYAWVHRVADHIRVTPELLALASSPDQLISVT